jgi:hypothetical protein
MSHQQFSLLMGKKEIEEKKFNEEDGIDEKEFREHEIEKIFHFYDIEEDVKEDPNANKGQEE